MYNFHSSLFIEKDFDGIALSQQKKENPLYYKDLVRQSIVEKNHTKKTPREIFDEEQAQIKAAFKMAAEEAEPEDDLFKVKQRTEQQVENENIEFQKFLEDEKRKSKPEEIDYLQRYWGDESKLDNTDKFLRKFILTKGYLITLKLFINI